MTWESVPRVAIAAQAAPLLRDETFGADLGILVLSGLLVLLLLALVRGRRLVVLQFGFVAVMLIYLVTIVVIFSN